MATADDIDRAWRALGRPSDSPVVWQRRVVRVDGKPIPCGPGEPRGEWEAGIGPQTSDRGDDFFVYGATAQAAMDALHGRLLARSSDGSDAAPLPLTTARGASAEAPLVLAVRDLLCDAVARVVAGGVDEEVALASAVGGARIDHMASVVSRGIYLATWGRPVAASLVGSVAVLRRTV